MLTVSRLRRQRAAQERRPPGGRALRHTRRAGSSATPVVRPDEVRLCHERLLRIFEEGGLMALADYEDDHVLDPVEVQALGDLLHSVNGT